MQEFACDFYETGEGCCLLCPESHPGCLCIECNCTKCYWYSSPYERDGEHGHCDKADELKEEGRIEAKKRYRLLEKINFKKNQKLKEENKRIEKPMNNNWYSCQRCGREFISREDKIINPGKNPICSLCEGKIVLTKEETKELEEETENEIEKEENGG